MPQALITITEEHQTRRLNLEVASRNFDCYIGAMAQVADSLKQKMCPPVLDDIG